VHHTRKFSTVIGHGLQPFCRKNLKIIMPHAQYVCIIHPKSLSTNTGQSLGHRARFVLRYIKYARIDNKIIIIIMIITIIGARITNKILCTVVNNSIKKYGVQCIMMMYVCIIFQYRTIKCPRVQQQQS
jgi:hypothetical protein